MKKYDVAAYIWPAYTGNEPRAKMFWPEGMGEWETVREAKPKYEGHPWPRRPLWGYVNEADPAVMEMEISQAVKYGVNVFIYDWYWYDNRPFLESCLNDGFLKASNNKDMQFYLMWANHDANNLWNRKYTGSDFWKTPIWSARVNRADFEKIAIRLVDKYFACDNYYKIDGKPVFMLYDVGNFISGLGSLEAAVDALKWFRRLVTDRGYPGVFLQTCVRSAHRIKDTSGVDGYHLQSFPEVVAKLDADAVVHYNYGSMVLPKGDFVELLESIRAEYDKMEQDYTAPYFPVVGCGWDNNPRFPDVMRPSIIHNNTPENLEKALRMAKEYIDTHDLPAPLTIINAWNEWTEASYLQPDDLYGYGYLEAVKRVFKDAE